VIFELQSGAESRWVSALVNELPEQALVLTVVLLFWALQQQLSSGRSKSAIQAATPIQLPETSPVPSAEETVLVSKGQNECLIRWRAVDFISTAGNYVELFCDNETYLLRATMKQVEQRLPTADFVRIHRCHIVNISVIKRIETLPAGNGSVSLHGGQVLPISKGYKQLLRLHKFVAA
jgi:DNA-binding LytR/AlgR family response regulator